MPHYCAISLLLVQCTLFALAARTVYDSTIDTGAEHQVGDGRCIDDVKLEAWSPFEVLSGSPSPSQKTWETEFEGWQNRIDERMLELKATNQKEHPEEWHFDTYMQKFHKAEWNAWALLEEMSWRIDGSDADGVSEDLRVVSLIKEGHMVATAFVGHDQKQETLDIIGIISGGSIRLPIAMKNSGRTLIMMMVDTFKPKVLKGVPADDWLAKQYEMMGLVKSSTDGTTMQISIEPTCVSFYSRVLCMDAKLEDCKSGTCWSSLFGKNADIAKVMSCKEHQGLIDSAIGAARGIMNSMFGKRT